MESEAGGDVHDVAIGDDGAGHLFDGAADAVGVHGRAVALGDGPAMDCEGIDGVLGK